MPATSPLGSFAAEPATAPQPARDLDRTPFAPAAGAFFPPGMGGDDDDPDARTIIAGHFGALAGAFQVAVSDPTASALEALNMPGDDWYVGINGVPVGPMRLGELRSKAGTGAVRADSLVWREGFEDWHPLRTYPELLAIIEDVLPPVAVPAPSTSGMIAPVGQLSDPFAGTAGPLEPGEVAGIPRRTGPSPAAWLAIVAALGLGLTMGFVVFGGPQKPQTIVQYVQVASGEAATPGSPGEELNATDIAANPNTPVAANGTRRVVGPAVAPTATSSGTGLKGLAGLKGLQGAGPEGPSGNTPVRSGGQPLDSDQVQRTVSRYTSSVKRSCWQPALDTRDANAPSTARVVVKIQVAPSGAVQSVSTGGDPPGYRGLSSCIASRVRGWQFPASNGTTPVTVPFVFAAQ